MLPRDTSRLPVSAVADASPASERPAYSRPDRLPSPQVEYDRNFCGSSRIPRKATSNVAQSSVAGRRRVARSGAARKMPDSATFLAASAPRRVSLGLRIWDPPPPARRAISSLPARSPAPVSPSGPAGPPGAARAGDPQRRGSARSADGSPSPLLPASSEPPLSPPRPPPPPPDGAPDPAATPRRPRSPAPGPPTRRRPPLRPPPRPGPGSTSWT